MRYNQFGRSGLFVSELCLGTMTFGGSDNFWGQMGQLKQRAVDDIVRLALESGVNFIDTADVYSYGESEQLLGQALKNLAVKRSDVVIASKVFVPFGNGPNDRGASRAHIMDSIHASLERLQLDHIDLYQIHGTDQVTPIEETLRAMDDLIHKGLVRYIGISNWQAWRIMKALSLSERLGLNRFDSLQAYYSLAGRDIEREIVPLLTEEKLGLMAWSPLAGGLLSGKFGPGSEQSTDEARRTHFDFPPVNRERVWACNEVMREIAAAHAVSVAQVALAWLRHQSHVSSIVIGVRTVSQLQDNLASTGLELSDEDLIKLDSVSTLPSEYPAWMIERQTANRRPQPFMQ